MKKFLRKGVDRTDIYVLSFSYTTSSTRELNKTNNQGTTTMLMESEITLIPVDRVEKMRSMKNQATYMTLREIADTYGVDYQRVRRHVAEGAVPVSKRLQTGGRGRPALLITKTNATKFAQAQGWTPAE